MRRGMVCWNRNLGDPYAMDELPRLRDYERPVFFTGAGLSAESGIPTYRGRGGIWNEYRYEDYACQRYAQLIFGLRSHLFDRSNAGPA